MRIYKNAIDRGQWSGSGKLIEDNFDRLKEIWGGFPGVFALPSGITSSDKSNVEPSYDDENFENEITDHEYEDDNINDESIDGLNTQTINRDNVRPSTICKGGNTYNRSFLSTKETSSFLSHPKQSWTWKEKHRS